MINDGDNDISVARAVRVNVSCLLADIANLPRLRDCFPDKHLYRNSLACHLNLPLGHGLSPLDGPGETHLPVAALVNDINTRPRAVHHVSLMWTSPGHLSHTANPTQIQKLWRHRPAKPPETRSVFLVFPSRAFLRGREVDDEADSTTVFAVGLHHGMLVRGCVCIYTYIHTHIKIDR